MTEPPEQEPAHVRCSICAQLADYESAFQKHGWEEQNSYLPAAARQLIVVRDFKPGSSRLLQLQQCPECRTYYEYKTDYEFLVNGTEDEEYLARLTEVQAATLLTPEASGPGAGT